MFAYPFIGYWKDVGTIQSLWEANMDLLENSNELNLYDEEWKIYSDNPVKPAQYIGTNAEVKNSIVVEGCSVYGKIENTVLFAGVYIGKNTVIKDSVIMPNVRIEDNVVINKAIIGSDSIVRKDSHIGNGESIAVIAAKEEVAAGSYIQTESHIETCKSI